MFQIEFDVLAEDTVEHSLMFILIVAEPKRETVSFAHFLNRKWYCRERCIF